MPESQRITPVGVPKRPERRALSVFTIVVLCHVPFAPSGEVAAPDSSVEAAMRHVVGQEEATHIVETYEHMPWIARLAFTCDLASGGVKAIEGAAAVGKGSSPPRRDGSLKSECYRKCPVRHIAKMPRICQPHTKNPHGANKPRRQSAPHSRNPQLRRPSPNRRPGE